MNESLSVRNDEHDLYLKSLGMQRGRPFVTRRGRRILLVHVDRTLTRKLSDALTE